MGGGRWEVEVGGGTVELATWVCPGRQSYPASSVTDANLETNLGQQTPKGIHGKLVRDME